MSKVRVNIEIPTGSGRRRGWWKRVSGVNRSAKGGYAIEGDFVNEGWVDLPVGAVLVRCSPEGSVKNGWKAARVHVVQPTGLEIVEGVGSDDDHDFDLWEQTPFLLDCIEQALDLRVPDATNPLSGFSTTDLMEELKRRGVEVGVA
jgi:hypothetical protein